MNRMLNIATAALIVLVFAPFQLQANEKSAGDFIAKLGNDVVSIVSNKSDSAIGIDSKLNTLFDKNVDVEWISKFVLGKNAKRIEDSQKASYNTAYRKYLLKTYVSRFRDYSGEVLKVLSTRKDDDNGFAVDAEIVRPKSENINLQFFVRFDKKNSPVIYDVVIEGVSQLNTQRSEFDSIIARDGIDGLIAKLEGNVAAAVKPAAAQPAL